MRLSGWRRCWAIGTVIWLLLAGAVAIQWKPPYDGSRHARSPRTYVDELSQARVDFDRRATLVVMLVPVGVYVIGATVGWIRRGRAS